MAKSNLRKTVVFKGRVYVPDGTSKTGVRDGAGKVAALPDDFPEKFLRTPAALEDEDGSTEPDEYEDDSERADEEDTPAPAKKKSPKKKTTRRR